MRATSKPSIEKLIYKLKKKKLGISFFFLTTFREMLSKTKITIVLLLLTQLVFATDILCRTCAPGYVVYSLQSARAAYRAYVEGDCFKTHSVLSTGGSAQFIDDGGSVFRAEGTSGSNWWRACSSWSEDTPCCLINI